MLTDSLNAEANAASYTFAQIVVDAEAGYNDNVIKPAYDALMEAEKNKAAAAHKLALANKDLLYSYVKYDKDSLEVLDTLNHALTAAQRQLALDQQKVEYAQKDLDDFSAVDKSNTEELAKYYNKLDKEVKVLEDSVQVYNERLFAATETLKNATAEYDYQKSLLAENSNDYNRTNGFYQVAVDDAIAEELEGSEWSWTSTAGKEYKFSVKAGLLANEDTISNDVLNDVLDAVLSDIESHLFTSSDANTLQQQSEELEAQVEYYKGEYEDDLDTFDDAVEKYKNAAKAYQWSDENSSSTLYDATKAYLIAYVNAKIADPVSDDDKKTKASSAATQLRNFLLLRSTFDGFAIDKDWYVTVGGSDYYAKDLANDQKPLPSAETLVALFDDAFYNATSTNLSNLEYYTNYGVEQLMGENNRVNYSIYSTYGAYEAAKEALFGTRTDGSDDARYEAYSEEELDELYDNDADDLFNNYGSQGKYAKASRVSADFGKDIKNQESWKRLYDAVEKLKDANKDNIDKNTNDLHASYASLQEAADAITAARLVVEDLGYKKTQFSSQKSNKAAYRKSILGLIDAISGTADGEKAYLVEAYEITLKYMELELEQEVDLANEFVAHDQLEVTKAEKDLAAFKAGKYYGTKSSSSASAGSGTAAVSPWGSFMGGGSATPASDDDDALNALMDEIRASQEAFDKANADYKDACHDYEVAKAYYADVMSNIGKGSTTYAK